MHPFDHELPPPPRLPLVTDPDLLTTRSLVRTEELVNADRWDSIIRAARLAGVAPDLLLLGCFTEVLGRWSASRDLTVGLTRRGSVVPVSYRPRPDEPWLADVRRMRERPELATRVGFPVVFTGLTGTALRRPGVWLDNQVTERADGLHIAWDAVPDLFPGGLLDDMLAEYVSMVHRLATGDLAEVCSQLRVRRTVHHPFFAHAARKPDRIAVRWRESYLTYGELADMALCVASHLRSNGVETGHEVAVTTPHEPDRIAAVLGAVAVGAVVGPQGHVLSDLTEARLLKPMSGPLAAIPDRVPDIIAPLAVGGTVELRGRSQPAAR